MPPLFEDRTREAQIVLAVVVPFLFGASPGSSSGSRPPSTRFWPCWPRSAASSPASSTPIPAGGARRVFVGGALFGLGILIAHAIAGTDAKVSLGGFPPLLILIDAIIGAVLGAIGGAISRSRRAIAA